MSFKRRAFVLEDEREQHEDLLQAMFPPSRWDIEWATNLEEARKKFRHQNDFSCVVVDSHINQDSNGGRKFLEWSRTDGGEVTDKHTPLFLLSRHREGDSAFTAHTLGEYNVDEFIYKPKLEELQERHGRERIRELSQSLFEEAMVRRCTPKLETEYGPLETVLVHRPTEEMLRVDPDNLEWYLLEMTVNVENAQQQHQGFVDTVRREAGRPVVLDTARLLFEVVREADEEERRRMVEEVLLSPEIIRLSQTFENADRSFSPVLQQQVGQIAAEEPETIVKRMLLGLTVSETEGNLKNLNTRDQQIIPPVPNLYFMRDPAFVLGEHIFLSRMYWPIRRRETPILRLIFHRHPFFQKAKVIDEELDGGEQIFSVEGGDIMAIEPGIYAIAESERTNRQAIERIAHILLESGAKRVYHPKIPVKRAFIHLDTVCSIAGSNHAVVHEEAIEAYAYTFLWDSAEAGPKPLERNFIEILQNEFHRSEIPTAGGSPYKELDQINDATNVLMVDPSTVVAYNRNENTNQAIRNAGLKVAGFDGGELVRGLGGPRCMTMPIRRGTV